MLIKITQLIISIIRAEDIYARIDGENFSILLPNISLSQSRQSAEKLRDLLDKNLILINTNMMLSIKSVWDFGVKSQRQLLSRSLCPL